MARHHSVPGMSGSHVVATIALHVAQRKRLSARRIADVIASPARSSLHPREEPRAVSRHVIYSARAPLVVGWPGATTLRRSMGGGHREIWRRPRRRLTRQATPALAVPLTRLAAA